MTLQGRCPLAENIIVPVQEDHTSQQDWLPAHSVELRAHSHAGEDSGDRPGEQAPGYPPDGGGLQLSQ